MFHILDLFAGIGGFSVGLHREGFETSAFCEIDPHARSVLSKNFPHVQQFGDISKLKSDDITIRPQMITGGFPCQDISVAGRGKGLAGERSGLWWEYFRLIQELEPEYVLAENSPALRTRGLEDILQALNEIGYDAEWHCLPACYFGAWHKRDRIWLLAYPHRKRLQRSEQEPVFRQSHISAQSLRGFAGWPGRSNLSTPRLLERDHGIPSALCEVKRYGNSVIPDIPQAFGVAIKERESLLKSAGFS